MLIITLLVFLQGYLFSLPQLDLGIQSSDRAGDLSGFFLLIPARHWVEGGSLLTRAVQSSSPCEISIPLSQSSPSS
jgi:hypothetical protein